MVNGEQEQAMGNGNGIANNNQPNNGAPWSTKQWSAMVNGNGNGTGPWSEIQRNKDAWQQSTNNSTNSIEATRQK